MDVNKIKSPNFLKDYSEKQLTELAADIRSFLIDKISKTGGHLSSNLGVVELTIALNKAFDFKKDHIFFDVGHQTYIYKILTGRAKDFDNLRKLNGISGFQKRSESIYDHWEAGHAGTSISAALADSISAKLDNKKRNSIVVIGDSSIENGESFEALNHIGSTQSKVIVVLNDNQMAINKSNSAFNSLLSNMRSSKGYQNLKLKVKNNLNKSDSGKAVTGFFHNTKEVLKNNLISGNYFDDLGFEYYGPVDGHNFKDLLKAFDFAKNQTKPVLLHIRTTKGKGFEHSEKDENGIWHGVDCFDVDSGEFIKKVTGNQVTWSQAVNDILLDIAKKDKNLLVLTPAMALGSKLGKFAEMYPERFFDCGMAEEHAATLAAGFAQAGKRPFISLYSTFLQRAYDQINHDICRMNLPVIIGVDRCGLVGEDGETHHGVFDVGLLTPLPNIVIGQPSNYLELESMLHKAHKANHPFVIRYPRGVVEKSEISNVENIEVGSWNLIKVGDQPEKIIITYGENVLNIKSKLEKTDKSAYLINARFIKPLDEKMLVKLEKINLPFYILEDGVSVGGLASLIGSYYYKNKKHVEINTFGLVNYVQHGKKEEIEKIAGIDAGSFLKKVFK